MDRRDVLGAGFGLSLAATASVSDDRDCAIAPSGGNVVLVHGAGHGGWCWRAVADLLRAKGCRVFTPTLTGLGERRHLRSPDITLETHIDDIVNLIEAEELLRVNLVAHSYGGTVITGVCDRMKERIRAVVFLDANTPGNGEPTIPGLTPEGVERMTGQPLLDGYLLPTMNPMALGIDPEDVETTEWVRRRLTEQPLQTVAQPIRLKAGGSDGLPRSFVLTTPSDQLREWQRAKLVEISKDPTWNYRELLVGHDAMIIAPCETAGLIDELLGVDPSDSG